MSTTFSRGENPLKADKLNTAFSERISRSGDTMTGLLTLVGNPVSAFDAATKQYVDTQVSSIVLHGGVLTFNTRAGDIVLNTTDVTTALGYVPYNVVNPAGYQTASDVTGTLIPYAKIDSPIFTGDPRAPTPAPGDADTSIATTAFVYNTLAPLTANFVTAFNTRKGSITLTSTDVSTALGYIPYDSGNPSNYQTYAQTVATSQSVASTYVPLSQKAAPLGVATLDAGGKLVSWQLPAVSTGTLSYKGGWNAATNTPVATSGALMGGAPQAVGSYYVVTATGTTAAIDGITSWVAGDWIVSSGAVWQRVQNSTSPYLPLTGGTLSGMLTLSADPTASLHAVTKQYSDTKVALAGGVMTGILTLSADPTLNLHAATKQYVDTHTTAVVGAYLPLVGGTLTGPLVLAADPATALQATTKQYADAVQTAAMAYADTKLAIAGGTATGPIYAPTLGMDANNVWRSALEPGFAWSVRDGANNIALALDTSGILWVAGVITPTTGSQPVPLSYLQANYVPITGGTSYLPLTGGTLTGPIYAPAHGVGTNDVWNGNSYETGLVWSVRDGSGNIALAITWDGSLMFNLGAPTSDSQPVPLSYLQANYLALAGGTMTGNLGLVGSSTYQISTEPGLVWSIRDSYGNVALALDASGTLWVAKMQLLTGGTTPNPPFVLPTTPGASGTWWNNGTFICVVP